MFCFSSGLFSSAVRIAHNSVTILHNIINLLFLFSLSNPRSIFQNNFVLLLPYCRKFSRQLNFAILKGQYLATLHFCNFGEFVKTESPKGVPQKWSIFKKILKVWRINFQTYFSHVALHDFFQNNFVSKSGSQHRGAESGCQRMFLELMT